MRSVRELLPPGLRFGQEDAELFQVKEPQLKAEALRYDVLPRLELLLKPALVLINKVYGADPLEVSTVAGLPAFRLDRRKEAVTVDYTECASGITGKRSIVWQGLERKDKKPAKIFPFRLNFMLNSGGVYVSLYRWWGKPYTPESNDQFHDMLLDHFDVVHQIMRMGAMDLLPYRVNVLSFTDDLDILAEEGADLMRIQGRSTGFPVETWNVERLVFNYLLLYPIYDAFTKIALKQEIRFQEHIQKLQQFLDAHAEELVKEQVEAEKPPPALTEQQLLEKARQKVPVRAGIRWRVLARDGWKCLACGRNTIQHGVVLHVDHIVPDSWGGPSEIENYQTLCETCNIGKSNKDRTDMRAVGM